MSDQLGRDGSQHSHRVGANDGFISHGLAVDSSFALPSHPRLQFGRFHRPGQNVGADYHEVLNLGGNRFAILMAAVSGPGAIGVVSTLPRVVRAQTGRHDDPGSLLHRMNEYVHHQWNDRLLATGIAAVIDTRRRTLRVACAGHAAPLLARRGGGVTALRLHRTMPLGTPGLIVTSEFDLCSGDRLLFFTGGITNGRSGDSELSGGDRLHSALQASAELPPARAVESLAQGMASDGAHDPQDDQTLLLAAFETDGRARSMESGLLAPGFRSGASCRTA